MDTWRIAGIGRCLLFTVGTGTLGRYIESRGVLDEGKEGGREGVWCMLHSVELGESVRLLLAMLGKCAVASSFCVIYLYTAELFPTEVR